MYARPVVSCEVKTIMSTSALMPAYSRLAVNFTHGKGCWIFDDKGNQYLDGLAGIAVSALGHCHPNIVAAIKEQADKLIHISNTFVIEETELLANELMTLTKMDKVFFGNSGAEANEAAIKLARLYGHANQVENPEIIVMDKAFHGRTLATLSASSSRKIQAGFEPLVTGFVRAPFNDIKAIKKIATQRKHIVAILLEPIPANSGIIIPQDNYLSELRKICDEHQWLLMLDEIQSGVGRTGKFYAYQHEPIIPDVVSSAKALANGIPIGACMARGDIKDLFQSGKHGSTFGGNPFAAHVARAVLKTFREEKVVENAEKIGSYLLKSLKECLADFNHVKAIRGKGLLIGIELDKPCKNIYEIGLQNKVLFSVTAENVIRVVPPLIISQQEVDILVERLTKTIKTFYEVF